MIKIILAIRFLLVYLVKKENDRVDFCQRKKRVSECVFVDLLFNTNISTRKNGMYFLFGCGVAPFEGALRLVGWH